MVIEYWFKDKEKDGCRIIETEHIVWIMIVTIIRNLSGLYKIMVII